MAGHDSDVIVLINPKVKTHISSPSLTMDIASVLGPVRTVHEMTQWAHEKGINRICLEKLLVCMKRTGVESHQDIPEGGYNMLRDFVYAKLGIQNSREDASSSL
jgi:hypothetical protein